MSRASLRPGLRHYAHRVIAPAAGGADGGPRVYLTFDDCPDGVYTLAYPYLAARNLRATVYMVTDLIGTAGYLSAVQLVALDAAGWPIGNHTKTHPDLRTLTLAQQTAELSDAKAALDALGLTAHSSLVAYPYGYYDNNTLIAMFNLSMETGRMTLPESGITIPVAPTSHYKVPSYRYFTGESLVTLTGKIETDLAAGKSVVLYMHNVVEAAPTANDLLYSEFTGLVDWLVDNEIACSTMDRLPLTDVDAQVDWWLQGGVPAANCIAAYQPKGAASLAASYVNLANPGTYDAAPGVAPTFDAATGWTFNGTTQYLDTGVALANTQTRSVIIRYSDGPTSGWASLVGALEQVGKGLIIVSSTASEYYNDNQRTIAGAPATAAIRAIAGNQGYISAAPHGATIAFTGGGTPRNLHIARLNNGASGTNYAAVKIQALAIYDATLTEDQISLITRAMAAL